MRLPLHRLLPPPLLLLPLRPLHLQLPPLLPPLLPTRSNSA